MFDAGDDTVNEIYEQERSREELVVRRLIEEGFNRGQLGVVDDLVAHWGLPDQVTLMNQIGS